MTVLRENIKKIEALVLTTAQSWLSMKSFQNGIRIVRFLSSTFLSIFHFPHYSTSAFGQ